MDIAVDTTLKFHLAGGRTVELDVLELEDFIDNLWETKGREPLNEDGTPKLDDKGDAMPRVLDWPVIEKELAAFVKAQAGADIKRSEAKRIWALCTTRPKTEVDGKPVYGKTLIEKKSEGLLAVAAGPLDSPNSPASTDHRLLDD